MVINILIIMTETRMCIKSSKGRRRRKARRELSLFL
jgi:hypothetical protein